MCKCVHVCVDYFSLCFIHSCYFYGCVCLLCTLVSHLFSIKVTMDSNEMKQKLTDSSTEVSPIEVDCSM